jgi:hypothetical protein
MNDIKPKKRGKDGRVELDFIKFVPWKVERSLAESLERSFHLL